jgi:hypothetical protein
MIYIKGDDNIFILNERFRIFYNKNNTIRYNGRVNHLSKEDEILSISLSIENLSYDYSFITSFLLINKLKEDIKEKNV